MSKTLSLETIAERIADGILEEKYVNKAVIIEKVKIVLRVWHKLTNRPQNYDAIKTPAGRLQFTIEKKDIELSYWRDLMKKEVGADNMQPHYDKLKETVTELGYGSGTLKM